MDAIGNGLDYGKADVQVSISSTFFTEFFCTKVFYATNLSLKFGFVIFWQKNIGSKAARKMLMKLTTCHPLLSTANFMADISASTANLS